LNLEVFPHNKSIAGVGRSYLLITQDTSQVELKLDSRFNISKILVDGKTASYAWISSIITINLVTFKLTDESVDIAVHYSGKLHIALREPWAGGFVWSETKSGTT
jgi:hypothetical protein